MNALIKTNNGFYCSTVYAYYKHRNESSVIVFNETNSRLTAVACAHVDASKYIHLNVLFADDNKEDWVENGDWQGFDFIVNDDELLKTIELDNPIPPEILDKCRAIQTTETFRGWNALDTDADIKKLMSICLNFHDGAIESIKRDGNDACVKFRCWSSHITIKFINLIESDTIENPPWKFTDIGMAKMEFDGGNIEWWVDNFSSCYGDDPDPYCYFLAERAQYKVEFD